MSISPAAKKLTVFTLVMITVGSVDSIRNLPATALFGSQLIFFFLLATVMFLIPCALASAELASTFNKPGGVYLWVKKAFGPRFGLLAIWFQWIENVIWYPTILSFLAGTVGYLIHPSLAHNTLFIVSVILVSFWGTTFINLRGIQSSARFSTFCTIAGLLVPMCLIVGLGVVYLFSGNPVAISFAPHEMMPQLNDPNMWVSLTGIMLSFCGMEIATHHASDVHDPQRSYPKALLISTAIIVVTLLFGSLALAIVVPHDEMSLVSGIMQAFDTFFNTYHINFLLPFIGIAIVIGILGSVSNWMLAPARGLIVAAKQEGLPKILQSTNDSGAPKFVLIAQAVIVTLLSMIFLLFPKINASYWLLTVLASQLYMLMYMLMFATLLVLRYRYPDLKRAFVIPGGKIALWIVATCGFSASLVTFMVGFIPPEMMQIESSSQYHTILIVGLILMSAPPFIGFYFAKPWQIAMNDG